MTNKNHSKLSQLIIVLVGLSSFPTAVHSDPLAIIDSLIDFKEDLFAGIFGKGKCGCPCQKFDVPKCEIRYVQECNYDHYNQQVCNTIGVPTPVYAKQTECAQCQKFTVQVPVTKVAVECNPVYDEKCKTTYPKHCKVETRCHQLYQTVCGPSYDGYGQACGSKPATQCYPETKCHRTPMTRCRPVERKKCKKVPREGVENRIQKTCLPFQITQAQIDAISAVDPCAGQGALPGGYGAPATTDHHGGHSTHDSHHHHVSHEQPITSSAPVNGYSVSAPVTNGYSTAAAPVTNSYSTASAAAPITNSYSTAPGPVTNSYSTVSAPVTNSYSTATAVDSYGSPIVQRDLTEQLKNTPVLRENQNRPGPHFNPYAKSRSSTVKEAIQRVNARKGKSTSSSQPHETLVSSNGWVPIIGGAPKL